MPKYLCKRLRLVSERHSYNTRQKDHINIEFSRTSEGQRTYIGFKMFNKLDKNTRAARNITKFKRLLKVEVKNEDVLGRM